MKILVIPDTHAEPGVSNDRFTWAGNLILDKQPDVVIHLGDFGSFQSLSHHEFGKKSSEGKRYQYDVAACIDAQERLFSPLNDYNRGRKRKYKPEFHITLGNHEGWVAREVETNAKLEFTLDVVKDTRMEEFGWNITPFRDVLTIDDIHFSHFFPNGNYDKPIGGEGMARTLVTKMKGSAIQGHSHLLQAHSDVTIKGNRIWGISAGCYFEHEMHYASRTTQSKWWRGLVILNTLGGGDLDMETISMETIKEQYR